MNDPSPADRLRSGPPGVLLCGRQDAKRIRPVSVGARARRTSTIGVIIGLALSALALLAVLRWAGWRAVAAAIQQMQPIYLALAAAVFLMSMLARAICWWLLLMRSVSLGRTLATLNEGYLLNNLLPWRLGELGRALLLGRQPGMSTLHVLSTIVIERTYDIILCTSLLLALLPVVIRVTWASRAALMWAAAAAVALLSLWLMVRHAGRIERWIARVIKHPEPWQDRWRGFHSGLSALQSPTLLLASFAAMAASWILAGVDYWLVLRAFDPAPGWPWAYFMLAATALGGAVPAAPGSIGVFEASAVGALGAFRVPPGMALAAALVLHAMVYAITVTLGAVALTRDGETLQSLFRDVVRWMRRREGPEAA